MDCLIIEVYNRGVCLGFCRLLTRSQARQLNADTTRYVNRPHQESKGCNVHFWSRTVTQYINSLLALIVHQIWFALMGEER